MDGQRRWSAGPVLVVTLLPVLLLLLPRASAVTVNNLATEGDTVVLRIGTYNVGRWCRLRDGSDAEECIRRCPSVDLSAIPEPPPPPPATTVAAEGEEGSERQERHSEEEAEGAGDGAAVESSTASPTPAPSTPSPTPQLICGQWLDNKGHEVKTESVSVVMGDGALKITNFRKEDVGNYYSTNCSCSDDEPIEPPNEDDSMTRPRTMHGVHLIG